MRNKALAIGFKAESLERNDIEKILTVQRVCYPNMLLEEGAALNSKLVIGQEFSVGVYKNKVEDEQAEMIAYIISFPWVARKKVAFNTESNLNTGEVADELYIHDLAVAPSERRNGIGEWLVREVIKKAKMSQLRNIRLISVNSSELFWASLGFSAEDGDVEGYGEGARYMGLKLRN